MSETDRRVMFAIKNNNGETRKILKECEMGKNKFSVYRDRLKKKSVIIGNKYGKIDFALPKFDVFMKNILW